MNTRKHVFWCICLVGLLGTLLIQSIAADRYVKIDKIINFKLEIGTPVPQEFLEANHASEHILVSSSQTYPRYNVLYKGIRYEVGIDETGSIVFISTCDKKFKTPEGLKVGMGLMTTLQISRKDLTVEDGWACFVSLDSGWNVAFVLQEDNTFNINDKIAFIFMRR